MKVFLMWRCVDAGAGSSPPSSPGEVPRSATSADRHGRPRTCSGDGHDGEGFDAAAPAPFPVRTSMAFNRTVIAAPPGPREARPEDKPDAAIHAIAFRRAWRGRVGTISVVPRPPLMAWMAGLVRGSSPRRP